jgi:hypothetical protein
MKMNKEYIVKSMVYLMGLFALVLVSFLLLQ